MDRWMKSVLSFVVLAAALYVLLFRQDDAIVREWALGAIGVLLGYWLKDREPART